MNRIILSWGLLFLAALSLVALSSAFARSETPLGAVLASTDYVGEAQGSPGTQPGDGLWRDVDKASITSQGEPWIVPHKYRLVAVDLTTEDLPTATPTATPTEDLPTATPTATPTEGAPTATPTATPGAPTPTYYIYLPLILRNYPAAPTLTPTVTPTQYPTAARNIDVTISLYSSPTGAARVPYENVIRYFADGVYEMSNGAHKLRRVTIYTGAQYADKAHIVWTGIRGCWPSAHVAGYGKEGWNVFMCDSNTSDEPYITNDADQQNGGYTTSHEWGHYYYGLKDEYQGSEPKPDRPFSPQPSDTAVENSVMHQQRRAITGTTSLGWEYFGDFRWLNFSTPLNDTKNTAQYRTYLASGWETLARPASADPRDGERANLPVRPDYPELAGFAPATGQEPSIQVPAGRDAARSDLQIVWMAGGQASGASILQTTSGFIRQIVIERSASMAASHKLDNVKAAAKDLVERAEIGDMIGIISFDGTVTVTYPLTVIAGQATKDAIQAAIDGIALGNSNAAIGEAAQQALNGLTSAGVPANTNRVTYLIADGPSTAGRAPLSVISAHKAAYVSLYTFGYGIGGSDADTLRQMADQTGGQYRFVGGLNDLLDALENADQDASPIVDVHIKAGGATVTSSAPLAVSIYVDASLGKLEVEVVYAGVPASTTLTLLNPLGAAVGAPGCQSSGTGVDTETFCSFAVSAPLTGTWTLQAVATGTVDLNYWGGGSTKTNAYTFEAEVDSLNGEVITSPQKIVLWAFVEKEFPITGAVVSGTLTAPDGTIQHFTLHDDGVAPDDLANDGIYAAELPPATNGDYYIKIQFDNSAGTAKYTEYSLELGAGRDDKQPEYRAPWPVGENFERFAELQVTVTGH